MVSLGHPHLDILVLLLLQLLLHQLPDDIVVLILQYHDLSIGIVGFTTD